MGTVDVAVTVAAPEVAIEAAVAAAVAAATAAAAARAGVGVEVAIGAAAAAAWVVAPSAVVLFSGRAMEMRDRRRSSFSVSRELRLITGWDSMFINWPRGEASKL